MKLSKNIWTNFWYDGNIEIGDSKDKILFGQLKFKRWDNDGNLSIRLDSDNCGNNFKNVIWTVTESDSQVWLTYDFIQLRFYKVKDSRFEIDESPEMETVLLSTPTGYDGSKLYELYYTIEHKGLNFIYQEENPPYDEWETIYRPDWAKKSYAIYFDKKHNKHKTGKFCHMPRPLMVLPNEKTIWNDFEIANKKLTVTINENLNNLTYPLRHVSGATLGYTSIGASNLSGTGYAIAPNFTATESGTVSEMYMYTSYGSSHNVKLALYESGNNTNLANDTVAASGAGWVYVSMTPSITGSTTYLLAEIDDSNGTGSYNLKYDSGGTYSYNLGGYVTFPFTDSWTTSGNSRIISAYLNYTASGGGSTIAKIDGIAVASIAKIDGIAIGNIAKYNGIEL